MSLSPSDMDGFLALLATTDTKTKMTIATNLINYLGDPDKSIECSDIGHFVDGLVPWMQSSNSKVSQNGIDAMTYLVDRMGVDFKPYLSTVVPPIIDRLGDSKEVVREKSQLLLLKLMEREVVAPQSLMEKLLPAFTHKNGKIREEAMNCLQTTLTEHGAQNLSLSKLVTPIMGLVSDPVPSVRETALNTLAEMYRHVGERLRTDLQKRQILPPSKMAILTARFNKLRDGGDMLPSALAEVTKPLEDELDSTPKSQVKRSSSVPRRGTLSASKSVVSASGGQAGAVDEDSFQRAFEDVPAIKLFSGRELEDHLVSIRETISDSSKDWSKRVDALKRVRSLMIAGAASFDELYVHLRLLEQAFQTSVKDLRSQVVREACYTIAYLSELLQNKLDHFAEFLLPSLINLIQNSAKIMASAGLVTVRYIITHTHSPRLIPVLTNQLNSKSKEIRRALCDFLEQMLSSWPTHPLERHIALLQDAIRKGIADADPEARLCARKAYWSFRSHFPEQAESLLNSLDSSYKRALNGDLTLSNSSSSNSLHHQGRYGAIPKVRQASSATGSTENLHQFPQSHGSLLHRTPSLTRHHPRSGIPVLTSGPRSMDADGGCSPRRGSTPGPVSLRSNSAIDLQAAQRAKARAQYAALARHKVGSGASLRSAEDNTNSARPKKVDSGMTSSAITPSDRVGRSRGRVAGVSQSQPSSRSGSPSSRLCYATYTPAEPAHTVTRTWGLGGSPRSTGTSRDASRETSPSRYDRSFGSKLRNRPVHSMTATERPPPSARPVMAQKILQQSREAETAFADAFHSPDRTDSGVDTGIRSTPVLRKYRSGSNQFEDHSDDSETSSVCSERSLDSFRRPSDSFSWSGSQTKLYRDLLEPSNKDVSEIIAVCASTHWADRKEGLVGLQSYFHNGNMLTGSELRRVTEIFSKMFTDSHTKVFSLFLDTLKELILTHKEDLHDWLYVLLTRLLNKLGGDLLGSIQNKIHASLTLIRESFPSELQMAVVMRFLVDPTQTPNAKVKCATLTFLAQLAAVAEPSAVTRADTSGTALAKLIVWSGDGKSADIRRTAQAAIMALFNLNTPQVTMLLASLPSEYQEAAATLVQNHLYRTNSMGGDNSSPPSPSVMTSSPRLSSPGTPQQLRPGLDDENLNPEEVYRSLRRTTAEIQNYSFEALGSGKGLDRDTTSQDSGISQMSAGPDRMDTLEEQLEHLSISNSGPSSSLSSPTRLPSLLRDLNGHQDVSLEDITLEHDNGFAENHQESCEALGVVIAALRGVSGEGPAQDSDVRAGLSQLIRSVRDGSVPEVIEHFKPLLRVLLDLLRSPDEKTRFLALGVLTETMKKRSIETCIRDYVELLLLKVLEAQGDSSKEVQRAGEACAVVMGTVLPPDVVVRVVNPLIKTGEYPVTMAATKMLTKAVEHWSSEVVGPLLDEVMPGLIKAYNNPMSQVRKSAVFCMVALHSSVGEDAMNPHLQSLKGSKLKLLHLYIRRAQQGLSAPTSPKNAPP